MRSSSAGSSKRGSGAASIALRPLSRSDREPIEGILRDCGAFREDEVAVALELVDAPESDGYEFVVAELQGYVAGYACFGATPMTQGTYDLYWIAVHPVAQGNGVGKALLRAVETQLRERGARLLLIETASKASYAETRLFYEASGCREIARVPDFYAVGDDKIVYGRKLDRPA